MRRWIKVIRAAAVAVGCVAGIGLLLVWLAGGFHSKIEPGQEPEMRVALGDAATVECEALQVPEIYSAVGSVEAVHETQVGSKILARVRAVHVRAGEAVGKDQVLVELDDADLRARLEQAVAARDGAKAQLDQARQDYERIERLISSGAAAEREMTTATSTLRAAEARYEQAGKAVTEAETVLAYAVVRSPMQGIVIEKLVEPGDMVQPGQALVKLYDRLQLAATVRESLALRLKVGEALTVWVAALDKRCEGQVSEIVPEADPLSRSFRVKVQGPCAPGVIPGMFGRLEIPMGAREALVVPASAVMQVGQLEMVLVVEQGFVRRQFVRVGRRIVDAQGREMVEVLSGLEPGQPRRIVAEPATFWARVGR